MSGRAVDRYHPMSIETLLTLGVAAAILVVAFLLRLVVLTFLRLGLLLAGRDASWLKPQRLPRSRRSLRPRVGAALRGAGVAVAAGAGVARVAVGAGVQGAARAGAGFERWADATNARLAPRTTQLTLAARRRGASFAKRLGMLLVAAIATVQHFASLAAVGLRRRLNDQRNGGRVAKPEPRRPAKVIDLDHDDDPVTPARRSRTAGVRL